jgi:hypothetical protein
MDTRAAPNRRKSDIPGYWFDALVVGFGIVCAVGYFTT